MSTSRRLVEPELLPFVAAVDAGTAAVMTSHVVVPALDQARPATLSAAVLGMLRDRLGFAGVVVSDALDMAGASGGRGIPEAAVLSIAAGADLLCIGPEKDVELVRAIQAALVDAVRSGRLSEERLVDAAKAIGRLAVTPEPRPGARPRRPRGRGGPVGDRVGHPAGPVRRVCRPGRLARHDRDRRRPVGAGR